MAVSEMSMHGPLTPLFWPMVTQYVMTKGVAGKAYSLIMFRKQTETRWGGLKTAGSQTQSKIQFLWDLDSTYPSARQRIKQAAGCGGACLESCTQEDTAGGSL